MGWQLPPSSRDESYDIDRAIATAAARGRLVARRATAFGETCGAGVRSHTPGAFEFLRFPRRA